MLSWQWAAGGDQEVCSAGAAHAPLHDLQVSKHIDKASPLLYKATATGQHIPEVVLTMEKGGTAPFDFFVVRLSDVLVTAVKPSFGGGDSLGSEAVTFDAAQVTTEYHPQNPDRTAGTPITFCFNAVSHQSC